MIEQLLGAFLVKTGKLTENQLKQVFETQQKVRVKLGLIAVSEKLMTAEQADEVNRLQAVMDKRFGDIAIEKGYLTDEQVTRLLGLQGNPYLTFVQAITDNDFMSVQEVEDSLNALQNENGYTLTDIENLKSNDPDRYVSMFLPSGIDEFQKEHILVFVRTVLRLIDSGVWIEKAYETDKIDCTGFALQSLKGDKDVSLALIDNGNNLKWIAGEFAKEEFDIVDLDALDAVAEFVNNVNGMFATKLGNSLMLDMLPPVYKSENSILKGKMVVLPLYVFNHKVEMISVFDGTIEC